MTQGHNVIEDYGHVGLTLREHPIAFLRRDLQKRNIVTCSDAMNARDGRWLMSAGLVLVRQKPGSAKGVMFITIEDETGPANVVVWPSLFEKRRRVVLGRSTDAPRGKPTSFISWPNSSSTCRANCQDLRIATWSSSCHPGAEMSSPTDRREVRIQEIGRSPSHSRGTSSCSTFTSKP